MSGPFVDKKGGLDYTIPGVTMDVSEKRARARRRYAFGKHIVKNDCIAI